MSSFKIFAKFLPVCSNDLPITTIHPSSTINHLPDIMREMTRKRSFVTSKIKDNWTMKITRTILRLEILKIGTIGIWKICEY